MLQKMTVAGLRLLLIRAIVIVMLSNSSVVGLAADDDAPLPILRQPSPKIVPVLTDDPSILARLRIPKSVIVNAFKRDYEHTQPVDHIVLGTHSRGTAVCIGNVTCELLDNASGAEISCCISGTITSETCGTNGPATIQSRAYTTYTATKPIFFDGTRFSTHPTSVQTTTQLEVLGVGSSIPGLRGRIVTRVANRRVRESKSQAEAVTASITEKELCQTIDAEFESRMQEMNQKLAKRLTVLTYLAVDGQQLKIRSSTAFVEITVASAAFDPTALTMEATLGESDAIELWIPMGTEDIASVSEFLKSAPAWLTTYFSESPQLSKLSAPEIAALRQRDWLVLNLQEH